MTCDIREMRLDEQDMVKAFADQCELHQLADQDIIHHLSLLAWQSASIVGLAAACRSEDQGLTYHVAARRDDPEAGREIECRLIDKLLIKTRGIDTRRLRLRQVGDEPNVRNWTPQPLLAEARTSAPGAEKDASP